MDYQTGSWIGDPYKVTEVQNTTDVYVTYDEFLIGSKFELIIDREVVAEDIGMFSCMANGSRESFAARWE